MSSVGLQWLEQYPNGEVIMIFFLKASGVKSLHEPFKTTISSARLNVREK